MNVGSRLQGGRDTANARGFGGGDAGSSVDFTRMLIHSKAIGGGRFRH
jgi:hypothetical protein